MKCTSVHSVGERSEQNPRYRRTMEDEHVIVDAFGGNPDNGFFGVYDGHGGREVVIHIAKVLHLVLCFKFAGSEVLRTF